VSDTPGAPTDQSSAGSPRQQGIAAAITEVSERASVLIREEIELAKTEITEKTTRLAKGAVVAVVAGVFFFTALFFVLIGCAWLLYYELPIGNEFTYFWGFFAMAVILVVLGVIAGLLAAKVVKSGAPPMPTMAIEEAQKIRETVSSSSSSSPSAQSSATAPITPAAPAAFAVPVPPVAAQAPARQAPDTGGTPAESKTDSGLGRGAADDTTLGS
jgi:hypothetical protein